MINIKDDNTKSGNNKSSRANYGGKKVNEGQAEKKQLSTFESGQPSLAIPGLKILDFVGKPDPVGLEQARRDFEVYVGREMTYESEIFNRLLAFCKLKNLFLSFNF